MVVSGNPSVSQVVIDWVRSCFDCLCPELLAIAAAENQALNRMIFFSASYLEFLEDPFPAKVAVNLVFCGCFVGVSISIQTCRKTAALLGSMKCFIIIVIAEERGRGLTTKKLAHTCSPQEMHSLTKCV